MLQFNNVMEVFKLLDKTNCRKCREKTCMAFAAAVFKGEKRLDECPFISRDTAALYGPPRTNRNSPEIDLEESIAAMRKTIRGLDLKTRAEIIQGVFHNERLTLKIMGKDFSVDSNSSIYTDLHVNNWVVISSFNYIIQCKGVPVRNEWVPFRELPGGLDWYRLFGQQCEKPLKNLGDTHPDLLKDLVDLFSGKHVSEQFQSDISVVLSPLPLVPMLICYWEPEDGMESSLNLFFDATAGHNLGIEGVYLLGVGITQMFEKLALLHGFKNH
ncbi:DUF3786 domain-containing protein [Desulfomarina sp.]